MNFYGLPDVVIVAVNVFLDDELSVVENEEAEDSSAEVQAQLKHDEGAEKQVDDRSNQKHGQSAAEEA